MDAAQIIVPIIVALITAGIPAAMGFRKLRRENTEQHSTAIGHIEEQRMILEAIHTDVREIRHDVQGVRSDLDRHLGEHDALKPYRRVK